MILLSLLIISSFSWFVHSYISHYYNIFLFSIIDFVSNNLQLSFLSSYIYNNYYDLIQNINAEINIENRNNSDSTNQTISINKNITNHHLIIGAWVPLNNSLNIQYLKGEEQKNSIDTLLTRGFDEYYFSMNNFDDSQSTKLLEELLKAVKKTNLKIIIILRPPSEGNSETNYDWKGWIKFFNSLERKYSRSFEGFTIDDFNWISTRNDTKFVNNIDFMEYSNLRKALEDKDKDIKFYPTTYFEGIGTDIVATKYDDFTNGLVIASGCYYNVSLLSKELTIFNEIFEKPIKYVVYPTMTYNYSRQGYNPPTERLIQATLSIASNYVDGLIIWRDIDNPVIRNYLVNQENKEYLSKIFNAKELQIKEEKEEKQEQTMLTTIANSKNTLLDKQIAEQDASCQDWATIYNKAYDKWNDLSQQEKEKNNWKKEILQILKKNNIK